MQRVAGERTGPLAAASAADSAGSPQACRRTSADRQYARKRVFAIQGEVHLDSRLHAGFYKSESLRFQWHRSTIATRGKGGRATRRILEGCIYAVFTHSDEKHTAIFLAE
ncbi:MAG: hypothetical protein H6821_05225 [Planctomycetaceae bacterium]|nr:hypothetical protein [Planctomycetaceae bacterium]